MSAAAAVTNADRCVSPTPHYRDSGVQVAWLDAGRRLHLQHGPIDLIVLADGTQKAIDQAYLQAIEHFDSVLQTLVNELPQLRCDVTASGALCGEIARAMRRAATRVRGQGFASPMIAVAGAVADHIVAAMRHNNPQLQRASVNNGGDIALYLAPGARFDVAMASESGQLLGRVAIGANDPVRGVATSGWRGRSQSLGIADSVTALARSAAMADAAATTIANAVNLSPCSAIVRRPAHEVDPDSELGDRAITVAVNPLSDADKMHALTAGAAVARQLMASGDVLGACLCLQGQYQLTGIAASGLPPSVNIQRKSRDYA